ncbi:putative disease resistance protein At4g11170 [Vigna radiata var. radiata]|uniref:Disease resistance protein At4g11170 n=1 Tax=Vigna radiata var. radiata TaxID=3916 RepID=A0A1S3TZ30_VIGRR|nr:putative disease resistance protein At4g11170 [Vigna radiata var. radiata]
MKDKAVSDNSVPRIKHDVFVSFRSEDIRRGFLTHLTNTFQEKKIKAFVDGQTLKGEAIWPSIVGAIEASSISVIIFSPGYVSSEWCLEELAKIFECRVKYGHTIIPVFYHVEQADILYRSGRYRRSPFAKDDSKHESKLQSWRSALEKSAQLSGIESSKIRDDDKLVKEIVNHVLTRLRMVNSKGQVGIDKKIEEVVSWIKENPKQTRLIGIWGKGGVGKTTLVEEVYNKLQSQYEGCYFLAHVTEELSRHGILSLKENCFSKLLGYDVKIVSPNSLPKDIVRRIESMKVLIVLDDVNDSEHLEKWLEILGNFGSGSRIIVTTRHLEVLEANKADKKYQLGELSSDEALTLFNLNAYNQSDYRREYNRLSECVVLYAKGIPLVIKVLAGHLRGKKKEEWQRELDKLEKMPQRKVYDVMKLSYDGLEHKQKQMFLDLACFFLRTHERVNVGYLKSLLKDDESDNSIDFELGRMKDKALITFSEDNNFVSMHDNLQQMAWEIVRQESIEDPGKRIRFWNPSETYEALKNVKGIDSIRSIVLHWPAIKKERLRPHIFAKMSRLQFLEIDDLYHYNSVKPFDIHGANTCWPKWKKARIADILAEGLHFLATELRFLCWYHCPLESLPENFSAEKLVILRLPHSRMEKLWLGVKNLVNLKELDLSKSKKLKGLPDLSKAINLEVLILRSCSMLTSVHPSIFSLPKLEKLDLERCESLTILASCSNLHSLSHLHLDFCENLMKFSLISDNMKELRLRCSKIKALPPSFGHQRKLELLHLEESGIERLPSLKNLTQLLHLDLSFCDKLQTIAELPPFLENLNVQYCTLLQTIPKLPSSLKTLNTEACTSLETLPELPPSIEILNVESCSSLGTIPELPPCLQTLNVQCCHLLRTIPKLPTCLKTLHTKNCTSLQNLPQLPPFLETLNATYCKSLKRVLFLTAKDEKLKENMKMLLFWNCSNLDKHSLVAIRLNMKINMMKFVANHISAPDHSHVEDYSDYEYNYHSYQAVYAYPGSNFPEWLEYKTTEDYIIIGLPSSMSSSLAGFVFCFVLGEFQHTDIIRRVEFKITVSDGGGKDEGERESVRMYMDYWDDTIESDNICVMYDQRCSHFLLSRPRRLTSFKIQITMEARISFDESFYVPLQKVLKGFGVSPISFDKLQSSNYKFR